MGAGGKNIMNDIGCREKILTFPGIGYTATAAGVFLRDAGIKYVAVPIDEEIRRTAAFRNAPEDMCLPFRIFAAQLQQAWEQGADTAVMISSKGPCRLGEFCELLRVILENQGCNYEWILLDTPADIGMREFLRRMRRILPEERMTAGQRKNTVIRLNRVRHLLRELEKFDAELRREAGYYESPEKATRLISACRKEIEKAENLEKAFSIMGHYRWKQSQLKKDFSKKPVKILLTGEIFTLNEPTASMRLEDRLTDMGVCLERDITLNWWMRRTAAQAVGNLLRPEKTRFRKKKNAYLPYGIGGYAKQSVEYAASAGLRGFDGVIHVFPSGCMPEIVGRSVLNRIDEKENIRVMTLVCDEMNAETGMVTRLEAFADMLQRMKGVERR